MKELFEKKLSTLRKICRPALAPKADSDRLRTSPPSSCPIITLRSKSAVRRLERRLHQKDIRCDIWVGSIGFQISVDRAKWHAALATIAQFEESEQIRRKQHYGLLEIFALGLLTSVFPNLFLVARSEVIHFVIQTHVAITILCMCVVAVVCKSARRNILRNQSKLTIGHFLFICMVIGSLLVVLREFAVN